MLIAQQKTYVPRLSKSRYISGKQCHLKLWNECFAPERASRTEAAQQAVFDVGHRVGELATRRYPGGEMIHEERASFQEASEHTKRAMRSGVPAIFEAAFEYQGVTCRVDVLVRAPRGMRIALKILCVRNALCQNCRHFRNLGL
jgi:hypothetical protein